MIDHCLLLERVFPLRSHDVAKPTDISCAGRKAHQPHVQALHSTNSVDTNFPHRPVGLKEAALDSPTSRATTTHFSEQVDLIEKWLDDYLKATSRLVAESATLESVIGSFISHALLPNSITEAILDHDYSVLAMKKYGEGAKHFWMSTLDVIKRLTALVVEPIRSFLQHDLRNFKVRKSQRLPRSIG